jgi:hypothetical protein
MTTLRPLLRHAARRGRDERGVTMLVVLGVMIVVSALVGAALTLTATSANNVSRTAGNVKAYDAAQAGVNVALAQLDANTTNWLSCPSQTTPLYVDEDDPNVAVDFPYVETYTYSTLPALASFSGTSYTKCEANNADSILDATPAAAGDLRMLFTGYAGAKSSATGKQVDTRSIVASFSPVSFTRFLYYSNYEVLDPSIQWPNETAKAEGCTKYYWESRSQVNAAETSPGKNCLALRFMNPGDNVNGPLWSNDSLDICETPSLGLSGSSNTVEAYGIYCDSSGTSKPLVDGSSGTPKATEGKTLLPPSGLSSISSVTSVSANAGWTCTFKGPTDIILNGNNIEASNAVYYKLYKPAKSFNYNYCRVIYVEANAEASCTDAYSPFGSPYDDPLNSKTTVGEEYVGGNNGSEQLTSGADGGCGDAYVSGSYSRSITIGAAGDIVINGSITNTSTNKTAVLGLAATNWVRIFHPIESAKYNTACTTKGNKTALDLKEPTIEAAILADQHSFILDNYNCGATLGKLNIVGSIAQNYRGPVSSPFNATTITTGYEKNYTYNPILADDDPPYFPTPTGAPWTITRETLCFGATGKSTSSLCGNPTE